jgi:hypothetical protein
MLAGLERRSWQMQFLQNELKCAVAAALHFFPAQQNMD